MAQNRNYYCTWNTQNFGCIAGREARTLTGAEGAKAARDRLDEAFIFGEGGLAEQYGEIRRELYFLLDDGWDVPYHVHPDTQIERFGSMLLAKERFPSFEGSPAKRLEKLNQALKDRGWRGAGLWVAAHGAGEHPDTGLFTEQESLRYWGERMLWCREAGIEYWKVDWGFHQFEAEWRGMLTRLRDRLYPSLHIEHSYPAASPLNHVVLENGKQVSDGRFAGWEDHPAKWGEVLRQSGIFRTYDVLQKFSPVSTLDRVEVLMRENPDSGAVLNCEDEVYIGAVLGCSLGIMRSGLCQEIPGFDFDPRGLSRRLDEVARAVNWQKLAPAFPIREGKAESSGDFAAEKGILHEGEFWEEEYLEREICQVCHSVIVRNMELPKVTYYEEKKPVTAAARHPNGSVSVLALPVLERDGNWRTPGAGITLHHISPGEPVGVFGHWERIVLGEFAEAGSLRVFAADLKDMAQEDITDGCVSCGDQIEIGKEVLERICRNRKGDLSEPGIVLFLRR